jgi:ATP:ADP antiporter, AAA family
MERSEDRLTIRWLSRLVDVDPSEIRSMLWSSLYFFCLLAGYYIIRPMRDEMALAGGVHNLPWLFTATLAAMLLANPVFGTMVAKITRLRFITLTYRFFALNLLLFLLAFGGVSETQNIWIGRAFYVWTSVFNLFVVSVFWAFMVDVFSSSQGKRLFGFIAFGGTLGGVVGSSLTAVLSESIGPMTLLIPAAILLEVAVLCARRLAALGAATTGTHAPRWATPQAEEAPPLHDPGPDVIGGPVLAGMTNLLRSSYLLGIAGFMLLFTITSTFLYFQQAEIVESAFEDRAARTALFARIDLGVNLLTILTQLFLTGRILRVFGVSITLSLLPVVSLAGFALLGCQPTLAVLVGFQIIRRAGNFALSRPARELLFTVVGREDKYKAKSFIDTFVYRAGDQLGAWSYAGMGALGLTLSGIAWVSVPVSAVWLVLGLFLGRRQARRAGEGDPASVPRLG